jgi:phosphoglycolate phosphatase-like HAD superfamily hydrolase
MRQPESERGISRDQYDAILLDLDGMITDTATVHASCWKQMFDEYVQRRAAQRGETSRAFDLATERNCGLSWTMTTGLALAAALGA